MIKTLLKKIPAQLKGEIIERKEPCRLCGEKTGKLIAKIDYWDIKNTTLVKCEKCGLSQLDPMLTEEDTSKGCLAYYIEESLRSPFKEQKRNLLRNFRRGLLFGHSLRKRNYRINNILEFGPGSGYFLEGLKYFYPETQITVIDINEEVLNFNKRQHQYETYKATPERFIPELEGKFDLIIARDIIEHVTDISSLIHNVIKYSRSNCLFHFITPNGHEDLWKHYLTHNYLHRNSELLINHVNYFDGKGLLSYLLELNFNKIEYYTYKLKTTIRGRGWKVKTKLMAAPSQKKSAGFYINHKIGEVRSLEFSKGEVLNKWYINRKIKHLALFMSWYHHASLIKVDPRLNVGHEIYGLFKVPNKK